MLNQAAPKKRLRKKVGYGVFLYFAVIIGLVIVLSVAARLSDAPGEDRISENGLSLLSGADQISGTSSGNLVPSYAPVLGPADAKVTIVEFSDFACPFCEASFPVVRQLVNNYPDDVRLVYRHMPLKSIHPLAEDLAHASMCAKEQGKFWVMHDRLFQNQESITSAEMILSHAQAIGANVDEFEACQNSGRWDDEIQQDLVDAVQQGGRGTPTWIVNGQLIQGFLPLASWEQIIDQLL